MKNSHLKKLSALTGALSVLLIITGAVTFGVYDYLPSAERLQTIFNENPSRVTASGYIGCLSAFFMIWFAGSFYSVLHKQEDGAVQFSMVAFGGGIGSGVALLISYSAIISAGARAGDIGGGLSPAEAFTLYDFYSHVMGQMLAITFAIFICASALVSLRTGMFPALVGWLSLLIAIGLLTPIGYLVISLGLAWLLFVSFWMFIRSDAVKE
jgi:Mn2+/Fe2+ NRAMP family transporter